MERDTGGLFTGPADDPTRYRVDLADLDDAVAGGEGLVYRARRTATGESVALKVLTNSSLDEFERVAARAALLEGVRHRNLMEQLETFLGCALGEGTADDPDEFDVPYSVARWIDGRPLTNAASTADIDLKLRWVGDLAQALDCLHAHRTADSPDGFVHRDVKPSNVRVRDDGSAVLLDFGVARPVDANDMTKGIGTYLWRAPEVLSGGSASIGTPADVWGLGAIAHWLIVGEPPQLDGAAASQERLAASLERDHAPAAKRVARDLGRLLHSSPADRPRNLGVWWKHIGMGAGPSRLQLAVFALPLLALIVISSIRWANPAVDDPADDAARISERSTLGIENLPKQLKCKADPDAVEGRMSISPGLTAAASDTDFRLTIKGSAITCDTSMEAFERVQLEALSFRIPDFSCPRSLSVGQAPVTGSGNAVMRWLGQAESRVDIPRFTLSSIGAAAISFEVADGAFSGYSGQASFVLSPSGTCESQRGVADVGILVDSLTLTRPA